MFCIFCFHKKTAVTNSRPHKKSAQIWRRRQCNDCKKIYTTYERPALHEEVQVINTRQEKSFFNTGRLYTDIVSCFEHASESRHDDTFWIARTIEDAVSTAGKLAITTSELKNITYEVLTKFDPLAGVQYAARHHLVTELRKTRTRRR